MQQLPLRRMPYGHLQGRAVLGMAGLYGLDAESDQTIAQRGEVGVVDAPIWQ